MIYVCSYVHNNKDGYPAPPEKTPLYAVKLENPEFHPSNDPVSIHRGVIRGWDFIPFKKDGTEYAKGWDKAQFIYGDTAEEAYLGAYRMGCHTLDLTASRHETRFKKYIPAIPHEMKASEYLAIKYWMCIHYRYMGSRIECGGCPFRELHPSSQACAYVEMDHPDKALAIVEQWAKEHPSRSLTE